MKFRATLIFGVVVSNLPALASAQTPKEQTLAPASPPKTKLEAFTGESGAVIMKGYTSVAVIRGAGNVEISAMTLRNAKTQEETKGLLITLSSLGSYTSNTNAFVDYDEISGLLAGIDYVSAADTSSTKLANFEAIYSTKGNLKITVFNDSTGINSISVDVNRFSRGAFLKMSDLAKIREAVASAKQILDNPDSVAAKGARLSQPSSSITPALNASSATKGSPAPTTQTATPLKSNRPNPRPAQPTTLAPMKLN